MTFPAIVYSFLLATFLGAGFHFWKGGGVGRLAANLILSWMGFTLGQIIGTRWGVTILMIGAIQAGVGVLGSLLMLFLGEWFYQIDQT